MKGQRKRIGWFPADYVTLLGATATAVDKQTTQLAVSMRCIFEFVTCLLCDYVNELILLMFAAYIVYWLSFLLHSAVLVQYMPSSCICLSVCPSQVVVLLKWLNVRSCKQCHVIAPGTLVF